MVGQAGSRGRCLKSGGGAGTPLQTMNIYKYVYTYLYPYIYIYTYIFLYIYIYTYIYIYIYNNTEGLYKKLKTKFCIGSRLIII